MLVDRPTDHPVITTRWVYKIKPGHQGVGMRFKARLVAGGFQQQEGIDYKDTFLPVVKWGTVRTICAVAAYYGWFMRHLDVTIAFLYGNLAKLVYVEQPPGFPLLAKKIRCACCSKLSMV
jgi:LSD1 subclass zinc finger protein